MDDCGIEMRRNSNNYVCVDGDRVDGVLDCLYQRIIYLYIMSIYSLARTH